MSDNTKFVEKKRSLFFGLPLSFTTYTITDSVITIDCGLLNIKEDDCYMYKVQDVRLETSLFERLFGLGTIICFTGDVTSQRLELVHVKNAREIKNFILQASEEERRKRRTINTQNISAEIDDDVDGD